MTLWRSLFTKRKGETVVLIDIAADSVAGGYAHYREGETSMLLYTRRLPIEIHAGEAHEAALLRALEVLGAALVAEGAPAALRVVGSGSADAVLVSIHAPWQETAIRTEHVERAEPFTVTKNLVHTVLERTRVPLPGKFLGNESLIGTIVNGYETRAPYGKRAKRVSLIILTSYIDERVSGDITAVFRRLYHTHHVTALAACSLRYQAMRAVFPHEADALVLDVSSNAFSIMLIRHGNLVAVAEIPRTDDWVRALRDQFTTLAKDNPLPRTIFLIATEHEATTLHASLDAAQLGSLWLSEHPPALIPVAPSHLIGLVDLKSAAADDLPLLLMALYYHRARE